MDRRKPLIEQFQALIREYPGLMLRYEKENAIIEGSFHFMASYNDQEIDDTYFIQITIPPGYPEELPVTRETGGRIPSDFHTNQGGILCLEVETKMKLAFMANPSLLFFIREYVLHYLYGYSYLERFGELPYGERPHGYKGVLDFYKEYFNTDDEVLAACLLHKAVFKQYRGHHECECGSGKQLRNCHGPQILKLINAGILKNIQDDYVQIRCYLKEKGILK